MYINFPRPESRCYAQVHTHAHMCAYAHAHTQRKHTVTH